MAPSADSISISVFIKLNLPLLIIVLEPLKQMRAALSNAKDTLALIQEIVLAYCSPFLWAISSARRLWYCIHSLPIPPVVVKIKGANVPCSTSSIPYWHTGASSHSRAFDKFALVPSPHKIRR